MSAVVEVAPIANTPVININKNTPIWFSDLDTISIAQMAKNYLTLTLKNYLAPTLVSG